MSNERLRSAIQSNGMTYEALAEVIQVDPKTVERWVSQDRRPHRRHRLLVSQLVKENEGFLWPDTSKDPRTVAATEAEFVTLYASRGAVPIDMWQRLLSATTSQVDVLAFAASFLHDALPSFSDDLTAKANSGVKVRIALGDPASDAVATRGAEEGIGDLLAGRCALSWKYFAPLLETPGVDGRRHALPVYCSLYRFDDDLLVNTHSYGAPASHSPVLHLRRVAGGRLFPHFMEGFETTWNGAKPA